MKCVKTAAAIPADLLQRDVVQTPVLNCNGKHCDYYKKKKNKTFLKNGAITNFILFSVLGPCVHISFELHKNLFASVQIVHTNSKRAITPGFVLSEPNTLRKSDSGCTVFL